MVQPLWKTIDGDGGLVAKVVSNSCDAMDRGAWQATLHEILQARILEWVAISFSSPLKC